MNNRESKILNTTGYRVYSTNMSRAAGCYVYDESGNKYLDLEAGVWALPLGHCDSDINRALHEQIDIMSHCDISIANRLTKFALKNYLK